MAVLHKASARRGGIRPRLWIDPNPSSPGFGSLSTPGLALSPGPISSLAASAADTDTATPTSAAAELFYVLCLYDYDAEDSDQLSFRRNDILDVVKKEDTVSALLSFRLALPDTTPARAGGRPSIRTATAWAGYLVHSSNPFQTVWQTS